MSFYLYQYESITALESSNWEYRIRIFNFDRS